MEGDHPVTTTLRQEGVTRRESRRKLALLLSGGDAPRYPPSLGGEDLPWRAALASQLTCTTFSLLIFSRSHQYKGFGGEAPPAHSHRCTEELNPACSK